MSGKEILENTNMKVKLVKINGNFTDYKITLLYKGKQFTFVYEELSRYPEVKISDVIYELLGKASNYNRVKNIDEFKKFMNYLVEDNDVAIEDYKYSLKAKEGLLRIYGSDINKLVNYMGF